MPICPISSEAKQGKQRRTTNLENFMESQFRKYFKTHFSLIIKSGFSLGLAISYKQTPLYSSNQNSYFVHGLVNSGLSSLQRDWFSQTIDPFPAFSSLLSIIIQTIGEKGFFFAYIILLSIFSYCVLDIVSKNCGIQEKQNLFLYSALLFLMYSGILSDFLLTTLPKGASVFSPNGLLVSGVAGQYVLGPYFQPSTFGIFLLLSICLFLCNKFYWAVVCIAVAVNFHPGYILSAAILTLSYMSTIYITSKNFSKGLELGIVTFLAVLPCIIYAVTNFSSTTTDIFKSAQNILANYRIPHHAIIRNWLDTNSVFQLLIIVVSIFLVKNSKLFYILLISFFCSVFLTVFQALSQNLSLALLFPWRISVILVPLGSAIILAKIVTLLSFNINKQILKHRSFFKAIVIIITLLFGYYGIKNTIETFRAPRIGLSPSVQFAKNSFQFNHLYLIPPENMFFRLAAEVPVFVDFKSHPYKDSEIIEWHKRIEIANQLYASEGTNTCEQLIKTVDEYTITHIVWPANSEVENCEPILEIFNDDEFRIYKVK
jgi:hypothetical protein